MPSGQDGVRVQIYHLTKITNKIDKIYEVAVGKTLTMRQWRTVTIERQKTKERSAMTAWAYWLQSFQVSAQEGVACAEPIGLFELRSQTWKSWVFSTELTERELRRSVKHPSQVMSWVLISMYMWENYLKSQNPTGLLATVPGAHIGPEIELTKNLRMHGPLCTI